MALASWWVGATPVRFAHEHPGPLGWLPTRGVAFGVFYLGLAAFCASWLLLGRRLLAGTSSGERPTVRQLRIFLAASAAPFALAAPFGRDLWAYAAQSNVAAHGLDPYRHGPSAVPGAFTAEVSRRWVGSPSPYGPLWIRLGQAADWLARGHPSGAALLLRLPGFVGLALCGWAIVVLARRRGHRAATALWLGLASPLTVVLGVGGGHNDLLMLGLALAGLAVAGRPGWRALAVGASLATLAVLVKSPAAIAVAFTVPIWLRANRRARSPRDVLAACAVAATGCAVTSVVVSVACGLGIGWTRQVSADAQWVSWLSIPSGVGMLAHALTGTPLKAVDETMRACRDGGELLAVIVVVALWLLAVRKRADATPLAPLTVALAAAALLAPSVQPWYYCWALAVAGLVVTRRAGLVLLATVASLFAVMITPDGYGLESGPWAPLIVAGSLAVCWWALRGRSSAADDDGADDPGAEVRSDDRTELGHV